MPQSAPYVKALKLCDFRQYQTCQLSLPRAKNIIITGANGVGKTNLLEALSMLVPGRGIRSDKPSVMQSQRGTPYDLSWALKDRGTLKKNQDSAYHDAKAVPAFHGWSVQGSFGLDDQSFQVSTSYQPELYGERRRLSFNTEPLKNQAFLSERLAMVWMTPQMEDLFTQGQTARRQYMDRLVGTIYPEHRRQWARYEAVHRSRMKLLREGPEDPVWLKTLEQKAAQTSVALAGMRLLFLENMMRHIQDTFNLFPKISLSVTGEVESMLNSKSPLDTEDILAQNYAKRRAQDQQSGRSSLGAHKSDFHVVLDKKGLSAPYCSTGEQKMILTTLTLGMARLQSLDPDRVSIVLLDEMASHLDQERRQLFLHALENLSCQTWMTGTDEKAFEHAGSDSLWLQFKEE